MNENKGTEKDDKESRQGKKAETVRDQTRSAMQTVETIREQWGAVIDIVSAACNGNKEAEAQLATLFGKIEQQVEWQTLSAVLRRILAGERDELTLLRGLNETDTLVAGEVLRKLGIDVPIAGHDRDADDDGKMMSLDQFLQNVAVACKPGTPEDLSERMRAATQGMATQPSLQPELRELGRVLNLILSGERNPDVSALHPQLADEVRKVLGNLNH
jgi:hypothetical protein